jgi:predicted DNA-binding transcriptional regulator YafY
MYALWEVDKILDKLCQAHNKVAQKHHKENHYASLKKGLKEKEKKVWESDNPKEAKKAVATIKSLIQKHKTQDLYSHIKDVFRPGQSSGLQ